MILIQEGSCVSPHSPELSAREPEDDPLLREAASASLAPAHPGVCLESAHEIYGLGFS